MVEKFVDGLLLCMLPFLGTGFMMNALSDERGLMYTVNFVWLLLGILMIFTNAYLIGTLINESSNKKEVK